MSEGFGYYLHVKHATEDKWIMCGPDPRRFGMFQIEESAEEMSKMFQSLGLQTRIDTIPVNYDDR